VSSTEVSTGGLGTMSPQAAVGEDTIVLLEKGLARQCS
jgi:hypothetical protein